MIEILSLISHALLQCGFDTPPITRWELYWQSWASMEADWLPWSPHALRNLRSGHMEALCERGPGTWWRERDASQGPVASAPLCSSSSHCLNATAPEFHTRTAQWALPEFWFAETRKDNKVIVLSPSCVFIFFVGQRGVGCFAAIVIGTQAPWLRMRHLNGVVMKRGRRGDEGGSYLYLLNCSSCSPGLFCLQIWLLETLLLYYSILASFNEKGLALNWLGASSIHIRFK